MAIQVKKAAEHANRPYLFGRYDKSWPLRFQEAAKTLKQVFGNEAILIEHVGSTSVSGMWAKPQIDILVTVKHFQNVPKFFDAMAQQSYKSHGDYTSEGEEYFTLDNAEGVRETSVHVLPDGHRWAVDLLDMRDYLRTHAEEVEYYSRIKRETNKKYPTDYTNYYKGKLEAIHQIRRRASAWRGH